MTKITIEDAKEAGKENLITTDKELKSKREDEVRIEIRITLEAEVRFKEQDLQKILVQGPQSEDFILQLE